MSNNLQRTPEWFAARRARVTGSRVAAILGESPWQKPEDVMRAMVREWYGAEPEFTGNAATDWGTGHEEDAKIAYEFETGNEVQEVGLIVHPDNDWLAASPDGLVGEYGTVEFKAPYRGIKREVPPHYWHQMQLVMECTRRDWCDYFVWAPDDTWMKHIERDRKWMPDNWDTLMSFYTAFCVYKNDRKKAGPYLEDAITTRADDAWRLAVEDWRAAQMRLKREQEAEKEARERLIQMAQGRTTEGFGVRVIRSERVGSVDYKSIPELESVDLDQYRKPGSVYFQVREVK